MRKTKSSDVIKSRQITCGNRIVGLITRFYNIAYNSPPPLLFILLKPVCINKLSIGNKIFDSTLKTSIERQRLKLATELNNILLPATTTL